LKIAFSTISCPAYTTRQIADAARRYGYDGVELYALEGQRLLPDMLEERREQIRSDLSGIPIVSINSWGVLSSPDRNVRTTEESKIARTLEIAHDLGSPLVKTFGGELPDAPFDSVMDYMAESLERLGGKAQALGVTLIVETHDGFCKGATLAALLQRVANPAIGALWDVHHPYRKGEAPEQTARLIGERVRHVHVKDAKRDGEGWKFVLLGEGELPVRQVIAILAEQGFDGYVALDWELMWHPEIAPAEVALPNYLAGLRQLIGAAEAAVQNKQ
jgi:sugar phosphate isomerase/epimerase